MTLQIVWMKCISPHLCLNKRLYLAEIGGWSIPAFIGVKIHSVSTCSAQQAQSKIGFVTHMRVEQLCCHIRAALAVEKTFPEQLQHQNIVTKSQPNAWQDVVLKGWKFGWKSVVEADGFD